MEPIDYAKPPKKKFPWARVLIWIAIAVAALWFARILAIEYIKRGYLN